MAKCGMIAAGLALLVVAPAGAQGADRAVLVQVTSGVESGYFADRDEARRELAARVEMAARMACADSWRPRTTIYESIHYEVAWSASEAPRAGQRKAIARNISVRCRP